MTKDRLCPRKDRAGDPSPLKKLQIEFTKEAVYRMSHKEARLGGWGSEGPALGRHISACATIIRLRALLYFPASYQNGVPIEKNHFKGGVPVEEKENDVNNINREVFQYIISRGSILGGIIYHII